MNRELDLTTVQNFSEEFQRSRANMVAMNAVTENGIQASAKSWNTTKHISHEYSIRLNTYGVTNQKSSGRCWMFAALNCMRAQVIEKFHLRNFELSQNFTLFYDKLEKANYFLETIIELASEPLEGRLMDHILHAPMQDGGQWDMIRAIVNKYGVVPKAAMPETVCSSSTKEMNSLLTEKLRSDARLLRKLIADNVSQKTVYAEKERMMNEVYKMLCICLGTPPKQFDFKVRTTEGTWIADLNLTPIEFYRKYVDMPLDEYISLIHAPTADKPLLRSYTVRFLGNVVGAEPVKYVNVPIETMKKAVIAQLSAGEPVWFGCDVGKHSDRERGLMDLEVYDYSALFDVQFDMTKAERLDYGHSRMTHAMVFQGVDLDGEGKPTSWCIENSWGDDKGDRGMFQMTDAWFDEYMYQVVVQRKYLSREVLDAYRASPVELAPWDPMGSLAR